MRGAGVAPVEQPVTGAGALGEENEDIVPGREAIAEILEGTRWVHCHSYRQDEILALLRTLDEFDITIGSFQHILEGYKVADAMAAHGTTGSAFAEWWSYKFVVYVAMAATKGAELPGIHEALRSGRWKVPIVKVVPLTEVPALHAAFERRELYGKTLIEVGGEL